MQKLKEFLGKVPKGWYIGIGIALVVILVPTITWVSIYTTTRNEGRSQEIALTRQWNDMQARYGQSRLAVADQLGIAREKMAAVEEILKNAVTGRYDKKDQEGVIDQQAVFSAIAEAYPDLDVANAYDVILTTVQAMRERFAKDQKKMQDMIRSYDTWRSTGEWYHPLVVDYLGFPSEHLEARVGSKTLTGKEALEKMSTAIIDGQTRDIFDTGVDTGISTK